MSVAPNLAGHSKAERFGWALKGAKTRIKEVRLNPMQAVSEGRKLADKIADKLAQQQIDPKDGEVFLVFAEKDNIGKLAKPVVFFSSPNPNADSHDLEILRGRLTQVPVGFIVCVLDRESGNLIAHTRPLLLQDPALKLLNAVLDDIQNGLLKEKDWKKS